jgi:hypothetical protein
MKHILIFVAFQFFILNLIAQNDTTDHRFISKKNESIIINLLNNQWMQVKDPIKTMPVSLGIDIYAFKQLLKKDRTFNISLGIGISSQNVHNNSLPYDSLDVTYFKLIPGGYEYTKNKLTTSYIDIPLEINLVTKSDKRNRNFKLALGGRFGLLISNYIKYVGEDFRNQSKHEVKFKEYRFDNINPYRYGIYIRANYGRIGLAANYSLSHVFKDNKGPDFVAFSYGISMSI